MQYQLHPLCSLFPRMSGPDFAALVEDIRVNGQREPITLHDGMILDGGNRYLACIEAGADPITKEFDGGNLVSFVLSANLHRRHMTPGQSAAIVASAQAWSEAQPVGRPKNETVQDCTISTAAYRAAQSGTSLRTQKDADKVARADPELSRQVAHGEVSLPQAVEQITGKRPGAKPANRKGADQNHYNPDEEALDTAHQTVRELAAENEALKDRLAVEVMPGCEDDKTAALNTIQELRAQVFALEAELDAVKSSRDGYMRENASMKSQMAMQRREIQKLKGGA